MVNSLSASRNMDGSEGAVAELCRAFARQLEVLSGLPVHLWDERRTTVEAHRSSLSSTITAKKEKHGRLQRPP